MCPYVRMNVSWFVSVQAEFSSFTMRALSDQSGLASAIARNQFSACMNFFVSGEIDREPDASESTVHVL